MKHYAEILYDYDTEAWTCLRLVSNDLQSIPRSELTVGLIQIDPTVDTHVYLIFGGAAEIPENIACISLIHYKNEVKLLIPELTTPS